MGGSALVLSLALLGFALPAQAADGVVEGTVRLFTRSEDGKPALKGDASGVVLYLTGFSQTPPPEKPRISQRNKTFIPDVLPIVVGQTVEFTNEDNLIHNVFSTSKARKFDLGPDGKFTLRGVPSGRHSLFAWSRRSEPQRVEIEVKTGETAAVALELAETKFDTKHVGKYGQAYRKLPGYP